MKLANLKIEVMQARLDTGGGSFVRNKFSAPIENTANGANPLSTRQFQQNKDTISAEHNSMKVSKYPPYKLITDSASELPCDGVAPAKAVSFVDQVTNTGSSVHITMPGMAREKTADISKMFPQKPSIRDGPNRGSYRRFGRRARKGGNLAVLSASAYLSAASQPCASGPLSPFFQMSGSLEPSTVLGTFRNYGIQKFQFGQSPLLLSTQLDTTADPSQENADKPGQPLAPEAPHDVSLNVRLDPDATSTEGFHRDILFSGALGKSTTKMTPSIYLFPPSKLQESVEWSNAFTEPDKNGSFSNPTSNSTPGGLAPINAERKRIPDDRPENDSYRNIKKAKVDSQAIHHHLNEVCHKGIWQKFVAETYRL